MAPTDDPSSKASVVLIQEDTARWRSSGLHRPPVPDVLVIDDEPDALEMLRVALSAEGMRVRAFQRSDEAHEAIAQRAPDVVVVDLHLAGERGETFARTLREDPVHSSVRLVAVTGAAAPDREQVRLFDAYLRKPVDLVLIAQLVAQLAAARRESA